MIPHKSRGFRAILDLSYSVRLAHKSLPSVNESTVKTAPQGAIDQMGHVLSRIIHTFAEAVEDSKIFLAKWDIKDGFWRLDCEEGQEWNFCYVLPPANASDPVELVVPTSLQMGWIESPPYFCAASETGRDVAMQYMETPMGSLKDNKFLTWMMDSEEVRMLPGRSAPGSSFRYVVEVYMDDYLGLAIPTSQAQLQHAANAIVHGIHDVFPANNNDDEDPISFKKIQRGDGTWSLRKDILGFTFDGANKTLWLEAPKRDALLTILHQWLREVEKRLLSSNLVWQKFGTPSLHSWRGKGYCPHAIECSAKKTLSCTSTGMHRSAQLCKILALSSGSRQSCPRIAWNSSPLGRISSGSKMPQNMA
jgi:hypothetical protein